MATTKSKKEILDYLWEWAENSGEWAKKLTKIAVEKESGLSESELNEIYSLFFKEITGKNGVKSTIDPCQIKMGSSLLLTHVR